MLASIVLFSIHAVCLWDSVASRKFQHHSQMCGVMVGCVLKMLLLTRVFRLNGYGWVNFKAADVDAKETRALG